MILCYPSIQVRCRCSSDPVSDRKFCSTIDSCRFSNTGLKLFSSLAEDLLHALCRSKLITNGNMNIFNGENTQLHRVILDNVVCDHTVYAERANLCGTTIGCWLVRWAKNSKSLIQFPVRLSVCPTPSCDSDCAVNKENKSRVISTVGQIMGCLGNKPKA